MSHSTTAWYRLDRALLPGGLVDDVTVGIEDGRFSAVVQSGEPAPDGAEAAQRLRGLTIPGLANCHSHVFHRALRGRTQGLGAGPGSGSFWTWRDQMYRVAATITPDSLFALARATFAEMLATGITSVGEFHYLHHQPDGTPYDDPNELGRAVLDAADDVGIRIRLLDTCYLAAGLGPDGPQPVEGVQRRFSDRHAERWAERVVELDDPRVGVAVHSVRAVARDQIPIVVDAAAGRPLHVHLSEQVAENEACQAAYGLTPTQVLAEAGALGPTTSAVHATHLTPTDLRLLGESETWACICPTTERDLADGIGPSAALRQAGSRLTLGSDSHAVIDLFEEMRAVELHERLVTRQRGHWTAAELITAATRDGHASLGDDDAGAIRVGASADLVTLDLDSSRTAGTGDSQEAVVFAATAADVRHVVAGGRVVHTGDAAQIGHDLAAAVLRVLPPSGDTS